MTAEVKSIAGMTKQELLEALHAIFPYGGYNNRAMIEYMPDFLLRETLAQYREGRTSH